VRTRHDAWAPLPRHGCRSIDRSLSDRSFDHKAIEHVVLLHLIGVAPPGDLESTVDAVEGLPRHLGHSSAFRPLRVHFHVLSPSGPRSSLQHAMQRTPRQRYLKSLRRIPRALRERVCRRVEGVAFAEALTRFAPPADRQGFGASPPNASRAERSFHVWLSTIAATETSAKA